LQVLIIKASGFGLEGYQFPSETYCFQILNTREIWLSKASEIQPVFCICM